MYFTLTNDYRLRLINDRPDLVREGAQKETRQKTSDIKLLKEINIWSYKSQSGLDTKTYWLTDCQSQSNSGSDSREIYVVETSVSTTTWTSADTNSEQDLQGPSATSEKA
jgi:hypothetical protein